MKFLEYLFIIYTIFFQSLSISQKSTFLATNEENGLNCTNKLDSNDLIQNDISISALKKQASYFYTVGFDIYNNSATFDDFKEAHNYFKLASDLDHKEARFKLAHMYEFGQGCKKNLSIAINLYNLSAGKGHLESFYRLGKLHILMNNDCTKAKHYLYLAADGEIRDAQYFLAYNLENNVDCGLNFTQALKYYRKAGSNGDLNALNRIGMMYVKGRGVNKDYRNALKHFKAATKQSHYSATFNYYYYRFVYTFYQNLPFLMKKFFIRI